MGEEKMNTRNNQRAKDTRERIIRAVFEDIVLEKKPISRITVRDVCDKARINRSTFYAHFLDVYDVMEKVEATMAKGLTERFLAALDEGNGLSACFLSLFEYVREYQGFYRVYFDTSNHPGVIGIAWDLLQDKLRGLSYQSLGYQSEEEMKYHGVFFIHGLTAMLRQWIDRDCQEEPRDLLGLLMHIQNDALSSLFSVHPS